MQRDMKVGMAVGVALIGIVGALFFRREPEKRDGETPPPMRDTKEIDRLIGEKGKTPYMEGVEDFPDRVAPVPPPQSPSTKSRLNNDNDDSPKFVTSDDTRNRERISRKAAPVPVPVQPLNDDALATDAAYPHNRDWEPAGPVVKKAAEPQRTSPAGTASTPRTHVIQARETLSGLAARYLGSSARYREIYETNRNVLRSPDDLRDGVTIVIPDVGKPRDQQHTAGTTGTGSATPSSSGSGNSGVKAQPTSSRSGDSETGDSPAATTPRGDIPREKIRFAPVKRGPFSAGRAAPLAGSSKSDADADRKPAPDTMEENQ